MAHTLTSDTSSTRYPIGWAVAIIALAMLLAAGFALPSKSPAPEAPIKFEALDENFAP